MSADWAGMAGLGGMAGMGMGMPGMGAFGIKPVVALVFSNKLLSRSSMSSCIA
jgi:hypothetical protein